MHSMFVAVLGLCTDLIAVFDKIKKITVCVFCKILVDCIHGFFCWLKRSILDIFAFMFSFECYWRRIITYLR